MGRLLTGSFAGLLLALAGASRLQAQDPLETETARFLKQGAGKIINTFEYQHSSDGTELSALLELEFGILDNLELAIEPVVYASIRPKTGPRATGSGDTEITLSYRFLEEASPYPALAVAAEVKLPTTQNMLIGTGKTDYNITFIASKQIGDFDLHANIGYSFLGSPAGTSLDNIFNFAVAAVYHINETWDLAAEVLGNTSSGGGSENSNVTVTTPEAAGGELSIFMGGRWHINPAAVLSTGVGYDNNSATLLRVGFSVKF
jgi:hypothetical protein